jgi:hypothetical protein
MANITLSELRTAARQKADMPARSDGDGFVSDTELNGYINTAGAELWDMLVTQYEDQFTLTTSISSPSPLDMTQWPTLLSLPPTGYGNYYLHKLRCIEWFDGSTYRELQRVERAEWSKYRGAPSDDDPTAFTMVGGWLWLMPTDINYPGLQGTGNSGSERTFRVTWIPTYRMLTADAAEMFGGSGGFQLPNRWEEYIVVRAAIEMLRKEESDISALSQERERLEARIRTAATNRDASGPKRIADTRGRRDYYDPRRDDRWR